MKLFLLAIGCTLVLQGATEKQTKVIPLDRIWAYEMPGTQDIRELEPKIDLNLFVDELALRRELALRSDVWRILTVLGEHRKKGENAGPAFLVVGTGKKALENAADVIADGKTRKQPPNVFPPKTELSVVFYSYQSGSYVHLVNVEQSSDVITLKFELVGHRTQILTRHFALIPIGKLEEGKVSVKVVQLRAVDEGGNPARTVRHPREFVSGSFSFVVQKR